MARPGSYRTASDTARRLGLTVRALRVYERHGLLRPGRTLAGWRVYGPEEMARLHQVLALKRLGLKLGQIADLLQGRSRIQRRADVQAGHGADPAVERCLGFRHGGDQAPRGDRAELT